MNAAYVHNYVTLLSHAATKVTGAAAQVAIQAILVNSYNNTVSTYYLIIDPNS